ncbi:MAG: glycoside hydrolase family 2 protein [candidate division KSB1 bacterium]|nr:glycoside hydrolase family 2 protein [candidate division KSB1 bacterium]
MQPFKRVDLHSGWEFAFAEYGQVQTPDDFSSLAFHAAEVPGTNLTDLQHHGLMPDATAADYEAAFRAYKDRDFIYRVHFRADNMLAFRHCWLCFDGLDTVCEIFLNGHPLATTENAFLGYQFDVQSQLVQDDNELVLIFRSPLKEAQKRQQAFGMKFPGHLDLDFMFLRKPAYSFFWDWGPELPVSGIFRPVYLKAFDFAEIADTRVSYRIQGNDAKGEVEIFTNGDDGGRIELRIGGERYEAAVQHHRATISFTIPQVKLWWPNGMGEPHLYDLQLQLLDESGQELQRRKHRIGFRTIELDQSPRQDGRGDRFLFKINGRELLARGYNWIPADNSLPRVDDKRYRQLLELARDGHVNLLRVWGGGFYENDRFYDLCDELGILVWQDAMFACAMYPDTDAGFMQQAKDELEYNIRRLRNHACLALWCGGNETLWGWENGWWGKFRKPESPYYGGQIYDALLPGLLNALDPGRIYVPNSPFSPDAKWPANDFYHGNCHYWELHWRCGDFTEYDADAPSFITETGLQSFPEPYTAMSIGDPADQHVQSLLFDSRNHYESPAKNERLLKFIGALYRLRDDFEYLVYLSNLVHGDYLRYAVEHWRCHAFDFSGTVIWQLNDCWPAISWSAVDYFIKPKAAYYALTRAFQPLIVVFRQQHSIQFDPDVERRGRLLVLSDSAEMLQGTVQVRVLSLASETRFEQEFAFKDRGPTIDLGEIDIPDFGHIRQDSLLHLRLQTDDGRTATRIYTLTRPKHMSMNKPRLSLSRVDETSVRVQTDRYARGVYLHYPVAGVFFDDNFFDLLPGEAKTVRANAPLHHNWLRVWSYYHA